MENSVLEKGKPGEKVLLVIVDLKKKNSALPVGEMFKEMEELVSACGGEVVDSIICRNVTPSARYLIGEGKVQEIVNLLAVNAIDTVIFSHDLKGSQQRNLENDIKLKTIDRTQLILDIFARRATSNEGKMQVELAQLEYFLPRLVGKGVELSRLGGGIGALGPGETKLEVDRRKISRRIARLKKDLNEVAANRQLKRKKRKDKGIPSISLVGYTNAGKSTLLNTLTKAGQKTKDGLFTTLDSVARNFTLPNRQKVIISDTVGFMHELPHHLIESFKATLEEVKEADLLLHVVDVSRAEFRNLYNSVMNVLKELEVCEKPVIVVLNKIDKLETSEGLNGFRRDFKRAVCISSKTGENIPQLLEEISKAVDSFIIEINVDVPINRMDLVSLAHKEGEVYAIKYYNDKINIRAAVPCNIAGRFR